MATIFCASAIALRIDAYARSAVSVSSLANGAFGERRRHDTEGMRLEIEAAWGNVTDKPNG
jgi:hypothetical protein